ncbi:BMP family protein [uncultured Anaerococcus sp.]|uniref:BMP family lipoprotein n=1 Tax=uncultured Anaerococcus sp. TaxID=293428 RepID=UPI00261934B1|nr:BMP family ABC transporter substrate-binding protein [uncultured Anaerococcus sp.]
MKIKKFMTGAFALAMAVSLTACGGGNKEVANEGSDNKEASSEAKVSATMITDEGGINDKSFNQSSYEGLKAYEEEGKIKFDYIESHKKTDYQPNLESALDSESDIIFTVGYALYNDTANACDANPDQKYAIIDNANIDGKENLVGITFADNENSFLVGYIAGMTSESNNVGFVGGQKSDVIDRFEYGYRAGVKQAAREKGTDIEVQVQYANSYSDQAAGKNIANQMYQNGADVVFHAAGGTGIGVFEAAKENDKYIIGVDRDQKEEAPDNILVSTIKGVGRAVQLTLDDLIDGNYKGGETVAYHLSDGDALGIAYGDNDLVAEDIKDEVEELRQQIIDGEVKTPQNEEEFKEMGYED